jgi:hypothetical protein
MFKVEFANDRHDWILNKECPTREEADEAAEKISQSGYTARIIRGGQIIHYVEREAK